MSNIKKLEMGWLKYNEMVIPPEAPESQVTGSKRAFYAGAMVAIGDFMAAVDPEDPEKTVEVVMDMIQEMQTFAEGVADGSR